MESDLKIDYFWSMKHVECFKPKRLFHRAIFPLVFFLAVMVLASVANGGERSTLAHIPIGGGAPNKIIRCMVQDARGFLWFGTMHGLLRYDGDALISHN